MDFSELEAEFDAISRQYKLPRAQDSEVASLPQRYDSLISPKRDTSSSPRRILKPTSKDGAAKDREESKAVAGAMRALQDKIRLLEANNERLKRDFESVEIKLRTDRENWANQSLREAGNIKSREETYLRHIQALEEELKQQQMRNDDAEDMVRSLREQSEIDKRENDKREESLQERIEMLLKQVDQKNKEILLFERNLDSIEKERTRFLTENSDLSMRLARLGSEVEFLKQGSDPARVELLAKVQENEEFLRKRLDEVMGRSNDLEMMTSRLKDIVAQKDRQIELMKIEVQHESNQRSFLSESVTALRSSLEKPKAARKESSPKKTKKKPKTPRNQRKEPQPAPTREESAKGHTQTRVAQLEREIQQQNEAYKQFLQQSDTLNLSVLRKNLNKISEEIEAKGKELAQLRKGTQGR